MKSSFFLICCILFLLISTGCTYDKHSIGKRESNKLETNSVEDNKNLQKFEGYVSEINLKEKKILIIKVSDKKKKESMWLTLSNQSNKVKVGDKIRAYIDGPVFYSNPLQATSKKIEIIN